MKIPAALLCLFSFVLCLPGFTGGNGHVQEPDVTTSSPWWSLAFQQKNWSDARSQLRSLGRSDRPPAYDVLQEYINLECDPDLDTDELPPALANLKRMRSALNWADWFLRVAPGSEKGIDADVLDAVRGYIREISSDLDSSFWESFQKSTADIVQAVRNGAINPIVELLEGQSPAWVELENNIPTTLGSGYRFVAQRGSYKISQGVRLERDAELWVERGTKITVDDRKLSDNHALDLVGHLRIYGTGNKPVQIVFKEKRGESSSSRLALFQWSGGFQHYTDLEFKLSAKGRPCAAIRGEGAQASIQRCSIEGSDQEQLNLGVYLGPGCVVDMSDCKLTSLNVAFFTNGPSDVFAHHNTFTGNWHAHVTNWAQGTLHFNKEVFESNESDLHVNGRLSGASGVFVFRNCSFSSQIHLSEEIGHTYDLRFNHWRKGPRLQIFEFDKGGASRAQYHDELDRKDRDAGARERSGKK